MLRRLHISGLGVIDDLDLDLHPGLNVLTGETGAGKTLVTVGLSLVLGERAASTLVREGASAARVQAIFDAPADSEAQIGSTRETDPEWSQEWAEDGELLLARTVGADGRSSARIGGQLATASTLARLGRPLVEIHGQHQNERLLSPAAQTSFLDRFAGTRHREVVAQYEATFRRLSDATLAADELTEAARTRERELDLLAYQVREIESVAPRTGETEELLAEERRGANAERLIEDAGAAAAGIGGDGGALETIEESARALENLSALDPGSQELAARARSLGADAGELARDLRRYAESLAADPEQLQSVRDRLAALRALQRKYGGSDADVLAFLEEATGRVAALTGADDRLAELRSEIASLRLAATDLAGAITAGRRRGAPRLARAVSAELGDLGMPNAALGIELEPLEELGGHGAERAELRLRPGAGQRAGSLAKTASGGELSRTMLACRSVLADLDETPTLVFDEIDAGIGGEAGLAVGRRLARLAEHRQVLVVTHLPQIACFADLHVRVRKTGGRAGIDVLDDDARIDELSRMLAGLTGSRTAASHAAELLSQARVGRVAAGTG